MNENLSIEGIQEAQNANVKRIAALRPGSRFGRLIRDVTAFLHRVMVSITHVDTGTLRASERMDVSNLRGRVFIDPGAVNPVSGERAAVYGVFENARGGEHAFFDRTVEKTPQAAEIGIRSFLNHF